MEFGWLEQCRLELGWLESLDQSASLHSSVYLENESPGEIHSLPGLSFYIDVTPFHLDRIGKTDFALAENAGELVPQCNDVVTSLYLNLCILEISFIACARLFHQRNLLE